MRASCYGRFMDKAHKLRWAEDDEEPPETELSGWEKLQIGIIVALLGAIFQQTVLSWLIP